MEKSSEVNSTATEDRVTIDINEMLTKIQSHKSSDSCIFKVPNQLRSVNEEAYEPQIIAIGPYHHDKPRLIAMQEHKIRYLQSFLERGDDENDLSRYVQIIRGLEKRARKCYAEPFRTLTEDKFVEMLLLDGCFIVEFIWKLNDGPFDKKDPIFGSVHILNALVLDLLLLENQLPFFILSELFVTGTAIPDRKLFVELILNTYKGFLPGPEYDPRDQYTLEEMMPIKNLVGLIQDNWRPSRERVKAYRENRRKEEICFTRCASELREAGIKFKCVKGCNFLDVKFENGTIEIPQIEIADNTERVLRNLIAYEQISSSQIPFYFTDYMLFMDSLIDSAKDVKLLCRRGIIVNRLGDDETIAILFNITLGKMSSVTEFSALI